MVLADTSVWIEHFRQGQSGACRTVNGSGRFDPSEDGRLGGRGIGWIDGHLLASALLSICQLWTLDKKLDQVAHDAGIAGFKRFRS
jgi:predicted nucleic acid-binding protein